MAVWPGQSIGDSESSSAMSLQDGSSVAVVGGGPAGSFFAYFLIEMAERAGIQLRVDVFEPRDFSLRAPRGCNMCGGIISESLVQNLASEGINLPTEVVQRGIDAYVLHLESGSVRIDTPLHEKRIAAVYRGPGPRDLSSPKWTSFDGHLQKLAAERGARIEPHRVGRIGRTVDRIEVEAKGVETRPYDLVAVTVGVNTAGIEFDLGPTFGYRAPGTTKTFIREYHLGEEGVDRLLGSSMHVFLLNIPRLEFAAIVPKGEYATVCMLGEDIDGDLVRSFLDSPQVRAIMPVDWDAEKRSCQCGPRMNVQPAVQPFDDRVVFIGDCGITRLYKDGIGAAYRAAKAAATTAVFQGVSRESFRRHYWPICKSIEADNSIGRFMFSITRQIQRRPFAARAVRSMTAREQRKEGRDRRMSQVLWDVFTGSAPYRGIFMRTLHPAFLGRFGWHLAGSVFSANGANAAEGATMSTGAVGAVYEDGQVIVRQGDEGECMYVIQEGRAQVFIEQDGHEVPLRVLEAGDMIGEMAICDREVRSATVKALGRTRILTVDRRNFLTRIHEDPSLAFRVVRTMSARIRDLSEEVARLGHQ